MVRTYLQERKWDRLGPRDRLREFGEKECRQRFWQALDLPAMDRIRSDADLYRIEHEFLSEPVNGWEHHDVLKCPPCTDATRKLNQEKAKHLAEEPQAHACWCSHPDLHSPQHESVEVCGDDQPDEWDERGWWQ